MHLPPPLLVGYLSITGLLPVVCQIYELDSDSNVNGTEVNTGFVQIFGSKIQVFFQTFFQSDTFFFQAQGR